MQVKSYVLSKPFEMFVSAVANELGHDPSHYADIQLTFSHRSDRWQIEATPDPEPVTITVELTSDEADIVEKWQPSTIDTIDRKIRAAVDKARS